MPQPSERLKPLRISLLATYRTWAKRSSVEARTRSACASLAASSTCCTAEEARSAAEASTSDTARCPLVARAESPQDLRAYFADEPLSGNGAMTFSSITEFFPQQNATTIDGGFGKES